MVPHVDSDAAYLIFPNDRSCTEGRFFLGDWPPSKPAKSDPKRNGPILTEVRAIKNVFPPTAESETAGVFSNGKCAVEICPSLIALRHP